VLLLSVSILTKLFAQDDGGAGREPAGVIEGKRLRLWALERHDLLKNYQWANNRDWIRLTGMQPYPKSAADIDRWWETTASNTEQRIMAIKTHDGEYIGNIELRDLDATAGRAEVGILLGDEAAQGQGYGTEALGLLARFAFRDLRLHRLYARVLENNARAQNTFRRCGFKHEGTERQVHYAEGRHWDVLVYGLLATDMDNKEKQS